MDPDNPQRKLIDAVIETVCEAFHGVNTDPDVELQIIKVSSHIVLRCPLSYLAPDSSVLTNVYIPRC